MHLARLTVIKIIVGLTRLESSKCAISEHALFDCMACKQSEWVCMRMHAVDELFGQTDYSLCYS